MSIHVIGIIGLVVVFVVGTTRSVNLGAVALVMTFIVGSIFEGESLDDMYAGFPADLFVLLVGVTYLFGVAVTNGTAERIVDWAASLVGGRRSGCPRSSSRSPSPPPWSSARSSWRTPTRATGGASTAR